MGYDVHKFVVWVFPKEHANPQRCCTSIKDATFVDSLISYRIYSCSMLPSEGKGAIIPQTLFGAVSQTSKT